MASCPTLIISSNLTGLNIAEETCPGVLPSPESNTKWYEQDVNDYNDFKTSYESVSKNTINAKRKNRKGSTVKEDASGGFNTDVTKSNLTRLLQGFFFADARQPSSIKNQLNGTKYTLATADMGVANGGLDDAFTYASGHLTNAGFAVNDLIYKNGWDDLLDNGLAKVLTVGATSLTCTADVLRTNNTISSPPATGGFDIVGIEFESADANISYVSNILALTTTSYDFTANAHLFEGQWIFLGGDATVNKFANNLGYARIREITAKALVLEEPTWTPITETGTGKKIRLFFGTTIMDEDNVNLIKQRTYQLERTLGLSTEGKTQAEYVIGAIANEFKINIPAQSKATADLNYIGTKGEVRSGLGSDLVKQGTRIPFIDEDPINTSSNVYLMRMGLTDETSMLTSLFAYITEGSLTISNGATPQPAVGILGALALTVGNFDVQGSVTAYFTTTEAKSAIKELKNVSLTFILALDNAGLILDTPKVGLSGGSIDVKKDSPITIPLEAMASVGAHGYTASYTQFYYLPTVAMPS